MTHRQLLKALTTTALDSFTTVPYGGGNQLIFANVKIFLPLSATLTDSRQNCAV